MPNIRAGILPDPLLAIERVVEFARQNGFPDATRLFWDDANPEIGHTSINDLVEETGEEYRFRLGIDLGIEPLKARREWINEDGDDDVFFLSEP